MTNEGNTLFDILDPNRTNWDHPMLVYICCQHNAPLYKHLLHEAGNWRALNTKWTLKLNVFLGWIIVSTRNRSVLFYRLITQCLLDTHNCNYRLLSTCVARYTFYLRISNTHITLYITHLVLRSFRDSTRLLFLGSNIGFESARPKTRWLQSQKAPIKNSVLILLHASYIHCVFAVVLWSYLLLIFLVELHAEVFWLAFQ